MKNTMKKLLALLLALVLTLALAACGQKEENKTDDQTNDPAVTNQDNAADEKVTLPVADGAVIGQGAVAFTVEVQGADGKTVTFTVNTDEETVGAALLKLGVITGDDSEYGLYVKTVNGETADYDADGTYWGLYINGEYAMTGVDATTLEARPTPSVWRRARADRYKKETAQPSLFYTFSSDCTTSPSRYREPQQTAVPSGGVSASIRDTPSRMVSQAVTGLPYRRRKAASSPASSARGLWGVTVINRAASGASWSYIFP